MRKREEEGGVSSAKNDWKFSWFGQKKRSKETNGTKHV